jgi:hypothetical protein
MKKILFLFSFFLMSLIGYSQNLLNESFEGTLFPPGGWSTIQKFGNNNWERYTSSSLAAHTGSYMASSDYFSGNALNYLITPPLNVTGINHTLSFWAKVSTHNGNDINTRLSIRVAPNGSSFNNFEAEEDNLLSLSDAEIGTYELTATWKQWSVDLSQYIGKTIQIAFRHFNFDGWRICIDDVTGPEINTLSCPSPTNITFSNVNTNSFDINFTPTDSTETSWKLYYRPDGSSNWNTDTINTLPYTINNLHPSTVYNCCVASACNNSGYTKASNIAKIMTACGEIERIPYAVRFDSYTAGNAMPTCMYRLSNGSSQPMTYTYPSFLESTVSITYPYSLIMGSYGGSYALFALPRMAANININTLKLSCVLYEWNDIVTNKFTVGVMTDPTDASTYTPIDTFNTPFEEWSEFSTNFSNYSDTGKYIAFRVLNAGYAGFLLDNIILNNIDTFVCQKPQNLNFQNGAMNSQLTWTSTGNETEWIVWCNTSSISPFNGSNIIISHTPSISFTNLPIGNYDFAVQARCNFNHISEWSDTLHAVRSIAPTNLPYFCDFENTNSDYVWRYSYGTNSIDLWYIDTVENNTIGGSRAMYISGDGGLTNSYVMNSTSTAHCYQTFYLPPAQSYSLIFDWKANGEATISGGDYYDYGAVYMSDTAVGTSLTQTMISSKLYNQTTWERDTITIPGISTGTVKRISFFWNNGSSSGNQPPLAIDNISFIANNIFSCESPITINTFLDTNDGRNATFSWDSVPGISQYQIALSQENVLPNDNDFITVNDTIYSYNNLNPLTTYYVFLRSICSDQSFSGSISVSFRTACGSIASLPYIENFNSYATNAFPTCWRSIGYHSIAYFTSVNDKYLMCYSSDGFSYAVLPMIDSNINIQNVHLKYKYHFDNSNSGSADYMDVGFLSNISDLSSFTTFSTNRNLTNQYFLGNWEKDSVYFNTYTGTNRYLAFRTYMSEWNAYCYIDDVQLIYEEPDTVENIVVNPISATYALASWNNNFEVQGQTQYIVQLSDTANIILLTDTISSHNYFLDSLIAMTQYTIAVQILGSRTNRWVQTIFSTNNSSCGFLLLPFFEDFESYPAIFQQPANIPCWQVGEYSNEHGAHIFYFSSYLAQNEASNVLCLYNRTAFYEGNYAVLPPIAPDINIQSLVISLDYLSSHNIGIAPLEIGVMENPNDISTFTEVGTFTPAAFYLRNSGSLRSTNYQGTGRYIAFRSPGTVSIDNITIDILDTCLSPYNFAVTNITESQVKITWVNPNHNSTANQLYYKRAIDTAYVSVITHNNTCTLTGLERECFYEYFVVDSCANGQSVASPVNIFKTECVPIAHLPWFENFDQYDSENTRFQYCWTIFPNDVNTTNLMIDSNLINGYMVETPAVIVRPFMLNNSLFVSLPPVDANLSFSDLTLSFKVKNLSSSYIGHFQVGTMTDPTDSTTFISCNQYFVPIDSNWKGVDLNFNNFSNLGQYISFRFIDSASFGIVMAFDSVLLTYTLTPLTHTITATSSGPGHISPSGSVVVIDGSDITFTLYPDSASVIQYLSIDGEETPIPNDNSYTFTGVERDFFIHVDFAPNAITNYMLDNNLLIFPNPTQNMIYIKTMKEDIMLLRIRLYDVMGKLIFEKALSNFGTNIDLSSYPNGLYFIEVLTTNGAVNKKILKQ